jgi:hypothetical protein
MFSRGISIDDVMDIIQKGEKIAEYPEDSPYPSCTLLGFVRNIPIHVVLGHHVVLGVDSEHHTGIIITAYVPNPDIWSSDYKTRRRS